MAECISEDDLLDLAHGRRRLGEAPRFEAHLADCPACSALLATLLARPVEATRRDRAGTTLGPYRLDSLIGAGAMGEVYRGWDLRLHRHVALKVLSRQLAGSPDRSRRLEAEARAAAAITHPNVVTIYDTGTDDGLPFIVTELISGESLRSVIDRGPISRRTAIELALQLARGLGAAHAQGVVHRDLKPSNLIVTDDGTLKILDFGLAKLSGARDVEATEPGTLLGTAGYLSPEQARGEPADARSDIFAMGAILHELLTGRRAFEGATFADRVSAVLRDTPEGIADPAAPIILRCLDKDPRKRFQSATDLAWVLEGLLRDDAQASPPPSAASSPPSTSTLPRTSTRPQRWTDATVSRRTFLVGATATALGGAVLGRALTTASPARRAVLPEYRQHTFGHGRVASARFTRDGGSLLYAAAWEDRPLTLYTTRPGGGGTRALELPSAQLLAISGRGELAISLGHRHVDGFHQRGELALAPLEGGQPRALGLEVQHADFTPDGAELAIVRRVGEPFRLELPVGRVLLEGGWLSHPRVSPDGALVACIVHAGPSDDQGDLVVVPRTGGASRTIAAGWTSIDGLAWAPGGRALWISASRAGGNNAVRAIALDGRELVHVPAAGRLRMHDIAPDGRLAVTHTSGRLRMMAKPPGDHEEVDLALSDVTMVRDISGDGRSLVFVEFGDVDTANGAYLRPITGGPAVRLGAAMPVDLADDGRGVLALPYGEPQTIAVIPLAGGQPRPLAIPALSSVRLARWCAGDRILVVGARDDRPGRVWRFDPDGTLTPLTDEGDAGFCEVSPDGRAAAVIVRDRLLVIDVLGGGAPRIVPGAFTDEIVCGWYASGAEVLVRSKAAPIRVRRVDVATSASTFVREIAPPKRGLLGVFTFVMSHDGDAYAYSHGQELSRLYSMTTEAPGT